MGGPDPCPTLDRDVATQLLQPVSSVSSRWSLTIAAARGLHQQHKAGGWLVSR